MANWESLVGSLGTTFRLIGSGVHTCAASTRRSWDGALWLPIGGLARKPDSREPVLDRRTPCAESGGMALHPVLVEKLNSALAPAAPGKRTRRDVRLPAVPGKVHAVVGMRRAGKTTFLHQLVEERRAALPPERAIYLSFDDERIADIEAGQLALLLEEYYRRYPQLRGRETVHWFFDEIQFVPGWERFVRRVLDSENVEITVSGSSARMLSREVHTSLRGRGMETVIRPFSFREFLRHRGEEPAAEPRRLRPAERSLIEKRFLEFLAEGGFPEAQGLPAELRIELLQGYVDAVLARAPVSAQPGRQLQRASSESRSQGAGPRRGEGRCARHARPSARCVPSRRGGARHRVGAAAQLQSAQTLSGRSWPDRGIRYERPIEPRTRAGDGGAERACASQGGRGLRQDGGRVRSGLPRAHTRCGR